MTKAGPDAVERSLVKTIHEKLPRILYIHPYNHETWHVIPIGVVGILNGYPGPARGAYAHEVTPEMLLYADIVLIDLHWFYPLANIGAMAREIKNTNKNATIVLGGYTAGLHAKELIDEYADLDFVIAGDGERALERIISLMRNGNTTGDRPGIAHRGASAVSFCSDTTAKEFSKEDFITLDRFPALLSLTVDMQNKYVDFDPSRGYDGDIFPQIPIIRGCFTSCRGCYGNADFQEGCGRTAPLLRTAQSVAQDLDRCDADPGIHAVNLIGDFLSLAPMKYSRTALARNRDLVCYYAFCAGASPDEKQLNILLDAFKYCYLIFVMDYLPGARFENQIKTLASRIGKKQDRCAAVLYLRDLPEGNTLGGFSEKNITLQAHPEWDMPAPQLVGGEERAGQMRRFTGLSKKFSLIKMLCLLYPEMARFLDYRHFIHTTTEHPGAELLLSAVKDEFFKNGFIVPESLDFNIVQASAGRPVEKHDGHNSSVKKWEMRYTLNGYRLQLFLRERDLRSKYQGLEKLVFSLKIGGYFFDSASCWAVRPVSFAIPDSLRMQGGEDILEVDLLEGGAPLTARFNGKNVKVPR